MPSSDQIIYRSEFHPNPPLAVLEFLKNDLKVGIKYVVLLSGDGSEHLGRLWMKHVHLLCLIEENKDKLDFYNRALAGSGEFWSKSAILSEIPVDADSIDCTVLLGEKFYTALNNSEFTAEIQRIMRLNCFTAGILHQLSADTERTFGWAYSLFFRQYSDSHIYEYELEISAETLETFYKSGYEVKSFPNQLRLNWEELQMHYIASKGALSPDAPNFKWAMKALRIIFEQYQTEEVVLIDYQTIVYYGLFNKFVPAISLRKNIFFTLLRPFALGFYILVKMNVYFWKMIEKLFSKK
jgi:hypothetical protein